MNGTKRVCVITGAAGRLASAFYRRWASQYHMVALYHEKPPNYASQMVEVFDPLNPRGFHGENEAPAFALRCDLRNEKECERALELSVARFGEIDLLVNCAVVSRWGSLLDNADVLSSAAEQFHVNTIGPLRLSVLLMRSCWRSDVKANRARNRNIINLSSSAGLHVIPGRGQGIYSASKAALNMATLHMANEFASYGVRVNALAPDSFPSRQSTESVADAIQSIDVGTETGQIYELA